MPKSIYVASSVKNAHQPEVVAKLRECGCDVYDFHHPAPGKIGFKWDQIDPEWLKWTPQKWREVLNTPEAQAGYRADKEGMDRSECCVLVLPAGRSAHLEAGYMAGQGKAVFTAAFGEQAEVADLMALLLGPPDRICVTMEELFDKLGLSRAAS